ncbi:MAG TPA: hypothetical protein VM118_09515, partial [Acidobacteriota bacterium]|nr:hypothetical protein [Acidobacteriota bacterium]
MKLKSPHKQTARFRNIGVVLVLVCCAVTLGATARTPSTSTISKNRTHDLASRRTSLVNSDLLSATGNRIASVVDDLRRGATYFAPADVDTLPSPGMMIGVTFWDAQHNYSQGHQVAANPGSNTVHFVWTESDIICQFCTPWDPRWVNYNSYSISSGTTNQGFNGVTVSQGEWSRSGMPRIDVDGNNLAHLVMHQRIELGAPYTNWHLLFPIEGSALHEDSVLSPNPRHNAGDLWPDVAIEQRSGFALPQFLQNGPNVRHVIGSGGIAVGGGMSHP